MNTLDEAKSIWGSHNEKSKIDLTKDSVSLMIKSRIKNEKNTVAQYMIISWVWQFIVYTFGVNMIVRFWNNTSLLLVSLTGLLLYIPFTIAYARFCSKSIHGFGKQNVGSFNIGEDIKFQYQNINRFFSFKKKFDIIGIPVTGFIIIMVLSSLAFIPDPTLNPFPAAIIFVLVLTAFIAAAYSENRKRFIVPLEKLSAIIQEIDQKDQ